MRKTWTPKEILTLKKACRRGLSPEAIGELIPRHSVRDIIARLAKQSAPLRRAQAKAIEAPGVAFSNPCAKRG